MTDFNEIGLFLQGLSGGVEDVVNVIKERRNAQRRRQFFRELTALNAPIEEPLSPEAERLAEQEAGFRIDVPKLSLSPEQEVRSRVSKLIDILPDEDVNRLAPAVLRQEKTLLDTLLVRKTTKERIQAFRELGNTNPLAKQIFDAFEPFINFDRPELSQGILDAIQTALVKEELAFPFAKAALEREVKLFNDPLAEEFRADKFAEKLKQQERLTFQSQEIRDLFAQRREERAAINQKEKDFFNKIEKTRKSVEKILNTNLSAIDEISDRLKNLVNKDPDTFDKLNDIRNEIVPVSSVESEGQQFTIDISLQQIGGALFDILKNSPREQLVVTDDDLEDAINLVIARTARNDPKIQEFSVANLDQIRDRVTEGLSLSGNPETNVNIFRFFNDKRDLDTLVEKSMLNEAELISLLEFQAVDLQDIDAQTILRNTAFRFFNIEIDEQGNINTILKPEFRGKGAELTLGTGINFFQATEVNDAISRGLPFEQKIRQKGRKFKEGISKVPEATKKIAGDVKEFFEGDSEKLPEPSEPSARITRFESANVKVLQQRKQEALEKLEANLELIIQRGSRNIFQIGTLTIDKPGGGTTNVSFGNLDELIDIMSIDVSAKLNFPNTVDLRNIPEAVKIITKFFNEELIIPSRKSEKENK